MPILPKDKTKVQAARESTSTHFPNETTRAPEDSDQAILNNQVPETLIDPEDDDGGSTHFNNEETYSEKSKKNNGGRTTAASAPAEPKKVQPTKATAPATGKNPKPVPLAPETGPKHPAKANLVEDTSIGEPDTDFAQGPDADGDFPAGGPDSGTMASTRLSADSEEETGQQDTQHMPNDQDPAAGYLTVSSEGEGPTTALPGTGQDPTCDVDLEGQNPQSGLEVEGAGADDMGDDAGDDAEAPAELEEIDDMAEPAVPEINDPLAQEDEAFETPAAGPASEDMAIMDVDGMDDEVDNCYMANIGSSVKVIKGNRIIASMGKKQAARAQCEAHYLGDPFQDATMATMATHGVRAGLKKMGFVFATVNIGRAEVLNKRVEAKAKKLTAAVQAEANARSEVLEQCLAIAAVGINRQYFKDTRNELRASLIEELESANVRGADKMVRRVFASKGVDYAKAILMLAMKLTNKSEEVRAEYVEALDLTSEGEVEDDKDLFGDSASPDFQAEYSAADEGMDGMEDDEFADDIAEQQAPQTVSAALARGPARRTRQEVSAKSVGYSVTAQAILSGKTPFPTY
jgi:hypothetical protein